MEIEIKLGPLTMQQTGDIFCDIKRLPVNGPARAIKMQTTYFDTPEGFFRQRRQTLRLRQEDDRPVCTFKSATTGISRLELECEAATIEEGAAILALHPDMPEETRQALAGGTFVPTCGAKFTRQTRLCKVGDTTFELCADMGRLFNGRRTQQMHEVELELAEGDPAVLEAVARQLMEAYGVTLCHKSKQQRAVELGEVSP
ncbi:MAG: CYTH domain-containing protein [Clostridia bacterium]|nr:CYTH domain-containing protein [Clostridia bacterium]